MATPSSNAIKSSGRIVSDVLAVGAINHHAIGGKWALLTEGLAKAMQGIRAPLIPIPRITERHSATNSAVAPDGRQSSNVVLAVIGVSCRSGTIALECPLLNCVVPPTATV